MKKGFVQMLSWGFALAAVVAFTPNAEAASANLPLRARFVRAPRFSELRRTETPSGDATLRRELNVDGRSVTASLTQSATATAGSVTVVHYDYH